MDVRGDIRGVRAGAGSGIIRGHLLGDVGGKRRHRLVAGERVRVLIGRSFAHDAVALGASLPKDLLTSAVSGSRGRARTDERREPDD